jgi:hypothetical protein
MPWMARVDEARVETTHDLCTNIECPKTTILSAHERTAPIGPPTKP